MGLPRTDSSGTKQLRVIAKLQDDITFTKGYEWADGKALFDTSTRHICKLQHSGKGITHISIAKWPNYMQTPLNLKSIWTNTWLPYLAQKEYTLVWQIVYRALASNAQRWRKLLSSDEHKHYKHYLL